MWRRIIASTTLLQSVPVSPASICTSAATGNQRGATGGRNKPSRTKGRILRQFLVPLMTAALILTWLPLTRSGTALAFWPTERWKYGRDFTHEGLTRQALYDIIERDGYLPRINKVVPSIKRAIDSIIGGNVRSDFGQRYFVGEAHFTDERFVSSQNLLQKKLDSLISGLRNRSPGHSRILLGQILHAIQDFYSHSNWIEKGNGGVYELLGRPGENFNPAALAGPNEADRKSVGVGKECRS